MAEIQVQLTEAQARILETLAAERQSSVEELIRQSIDSLVAWSTGISADERRRRAIAAIGRFGSGRSDVSVHHDVYLAEVYDP